MGTVTIAAICGVAGLILGLAIGFIMVRGERRNSVRLLENEKENGRQLLENERTASKQLLENEIEHSRQMLESSRDIWESKLKEVESKLQSITEQQLAARQASLQDSNARHMEMLLKPVKEQFEAFKRTMEETRTQNEVNRQSIEKTFDSTMKLFHQEQEAAVRTLSEQTQKIGNDAAGLTRALKGDSKVQGNWGEMVLDTMLEQSGLIKDQEYFTQQTVKAPDGTLFRPDVLVRFPEGRSVIIDSKVSLTAYTDAVNAADDQMRDNLLKAHVQSMRKHIDELAGKDYSALVEDSIGYVLMFVPNEGSYIAAMREQPDLSNYAYKKHVILISPSNLLMALQLAYNLWQYDRQNKNVENIVRLAKDLYDKIAGFSDSFADVETAIGTLTKKYAEAKTRLYEGKGNVMRRAEQLKEYGVTTDKKIKSLE